MVRFGKVTAILWIILLAAFSASRRKFVQGAIALFLGNTAFFAQDTESILAMPILFLAEWCFSDQYNLGLGPMCLYGSFLLAYVQASSGNGNKDKPIQVVTASSLGYIATAAVCFYLLTTDLVLVVAFAAYPLVGLLVQQICLRKMPRDEALLVASLAGFLVCDAIGNPEVAQGSITSIKFGTVTTSVAHAASRAALLVAMGTALVLSVAPRTRSVMGRNVVFLSAVLLNVGIQWGVFWYITGGKNIAEWVFRYALLQDKARPFVLVLWFTGIPLITALIAFFGGGLPQIERRKLFHLLSVAAFGPVLLVDSEFLALAISYAVALTIVVEAARVFGTSGSQFMTKFLEPHIDERDNGLVRTHTYLMLAMGMSAIFRQRYLVFWHTGVAIQWDWAIDLIPGVILLGLCDAAAAVVGRRLGKTKWSALLCNRVFDAESNSALKRKTPMGTLGAFAAGGAAWAVVFLVAEPAALATVGFWAQLAAIGFLCWVETVFDGVDNLLLPVLGTAAIQTAALSSAALNKWWTATAYKGL